MKDFDDFIERIKPKEPEAPVNPESLITIQAALDLLRQYHVWANGEEETPSQD